MYRYRHNSRRIQTVDWINQYWEVLKQRRYNLKVLSDSMGMRPTMDVPGRRELTPWPQCFVQNHFVDLLPSVPITPLTPDINREISVAIFTCDVSLITDTFCARQLWIVIINPSIWWRIWIIYIGNLLLRGPQVELAQLPHVTRVLVK